MVKQIICEVTDQEFEAAKCESNYVIVTEQGLKGMEVAVAFKPRMDWPSEFKYYPLLKL